jgi:hypothetical protein
LGVLIGALTVVLGIGAGIGLFGRLAVPGRHGLLHVARRDIKLLPQLLRHDDEVRWEVGGGVLGALFGYGIGRWYDSYSLMGASPARWYLAVVWAILIVGIAIVSGAIERSRWTRRLGVHDWMARGGAR